MIVGLTYDLREEYLAAGFSELETAEFDRPDTIDAIDGALAALGYQTCRIGNLRQLAGRLLKGERWDAVFNIAEGMYGYAREAQVPALLEAYRIPCVFSDAMVLALTLHKGMTKRIIRDLGIPTPDFAVVGNAGELPAAARLEYPLFVKPVAEGTGRGIDDKSKVTGPRQLQEACGRVWSQCGQAALVETYLPGREFTVGITGTGAAAELVGVAEIVMRGGKDATYSYESKENCEELVDYLRAEGEAAEAAAQTALAAWRGLGCRDGGRVDIRLDAGGTAHFLEVNPLAGLHPQHSDLPILATLCGIPYLELMRRIMVSLCNRVGLPPPDPGRQAGGRGCARSAAA